MPERTRSAGIRGRRARLERLKAPRALPDGAALDRVLGAIKRGVYAGQDPEDPEVHVHGFPVVQLAIRYGATLEPATARSDRGPMGATMKPGRGAGFSVVPACCPEDWPQDPHLWFPTRATARAWAAECDIEMGE